MDEIIIEYKAKISDLEAKLDRIEKDLYGIDNAAKKSMGNLDKEGKKASDSVKKVNKDVSGLSDKLTDLAGRIPGVYAVQDVLKYGNAVQGATKATGEMTTAMKALRVATYATLGVFLALVIPIVALIAYFKRTDQGATKLEGIMGALGAATDEVSGFIAEFADNLIKAGQSMDNFQKFVIDAASNIGKYILNRIGAPIILIIDLFKVAQKAIEDRSFDGAGTAVADALLRFATGFEKVATNIGEMTDRMAKAAKEAYDYALAMDAISDAQRDLGVELSFNEKRIVELIRQSKNHSRSEEERKALLKEANSLEEQGLNKTLDLEGKKLKLIQERNRRELGSINQGKQALLQQLDAAKTDAERFKIKTQLLSVNDDLAQEEADQIIKINNLQKSSIALKERNNNAIAALDEEILQNRINLIKSAGVAEENIYKQQYAEGLINEKQFQDGIINAQLDSLKTQKAFLEQHNRDTIEIDKAIADLGVKQEQDKLKSFEEAQKEYAENAKAQADKEAAERADRDKKEIEDFKKKQAIKKQILADSIELAGKLISAISQHQLDKDQAEIESERSKNEAETASLLANIDKRQEAGTLSEQSAAAQKEAIQKRSAQKESELKKKSFEAQKRADLTQILINTAVAITKAFATLAYPANVIAAAFAAAEGAVQYGVVSSKPTPKFKEGGMIEGKSHSQGGVLIEAEGGEFITKVSQTRKYKGLLESINKDDVESYINRDYLKPLLEKQKKEHDRELRMREAALHLATSGMDTSHMERLIKRNKKVGFESSDSLELAKMIAREMKSGNNPRMK